MKLFGAVFAAFASWSPAAAAIEDLPLVSFAARLNTNFHELNDPVMGGQSVGNFTDEGACGLFQGEVKNVTFLDAPGFCNIQMFPGPLHELDLSPFVTADLTGGIRMKVAYAQPAGQQPFAKYRFGLSAKNIPKHAGQAHELEGQYKGNFVVKPAKLTNPGNNGNKNKLRGAMPVASTDDDAHEQCQTVTIPFSAFSSDWSDFTGECGGTDPDGVKHACCTANSPDVCPTPERVKDVDVITVWAEGVEGPFALRIYEINATADATAAGTGEVGPC